MNDSPARFALEFLEPVGALNAQRGDRILVRVGHHEPDVLLHYPASDYAPILAALEGGTAQPLDRGQDVASITVLLRSLCPPRTAGRHLKLIP